MSLSKTQFVEQGYDALNDYNQDNRWFGFLTGGVWERTWEPGQYIVTAAECYVKAKDASLQMCILGDDKIRRDSEIVGNFGLCTAMDGLEPDVQQIVDRREAERRGPSPAPNPMAASPSSSSASAPNPFANAGRPPFSSSSSAAPPVAGNDNRVADRGAVLATRGWSPMLNDGFILGGVHSGHPFHLVLSQADRQRFLALSAGRQPREAWLEYFKKKESQRMFWDPEKGKPRVFMREMIGLEAFGYAVEFNDVEGVVFTLKDKNRAANASLKGYIGALRPVQNAGNGGPAGSSAASASSSAGGGSRRPRDFTLETEANILGIAGDILFASENVLRG